MKNINYFNDDLAKRFYLDIKESLEEWRSRKLPRHMLTNLGIKEPDFNTEEVIITLHFNIKEGNTETKNQDYDNRLISPD